MYRKYYLKIIAHKILSSDNRSVYIGNVVNSKNHHYETFFLLLLTYTKKDIL